MNWKTVSSASAEAGTMSMKHVLRTLLACLFAWWLVSHGAFAETGTSGSDATRGLKNAIDQTTNITSGLIGSAIGLSHKVTPEANKLAFALAVITLTLASIRFMGAMHPIGAWVNLIETLSIVGIFAAIYLGYDSFATGLYEWFRALAASLSGDDKLSIASTLATTAGKLWAAVGRVVLAGELLQGIVTALVLFFAFVVVALTAFVYAFFMMLGEIQVAIGIVLGPIAVALALSDYTRRYFMSWLDFMIGSCMYVVIAAVLANLIGGTMEPSLSKMNNIGTDTVAAAAYALGIAIMLFMVSLEIPKLAGAVFGSGAGASGSGPLTAAGKGAWKLGAKLAGK
ncbi:type IV secretion system protein [Cupriavidus taiwanensis]|uniref:type IV secretion system protein n=1 Tax=Cupriavidus taiwanensis TaxID=164546 RepID=UPI0025410750|nr:type IV secretion system protein [Cupriavidus taiwanensis]MDK3022953.1 type IV secretion system protein [Cupriavidus taiwanensis]